MVTCSNTLKWKIFMKKHQDIRDSVAALCQDFPGRYWQTKDRERAYPSEFVNALTKAGFLGVLIPEIYGGSGLGISEASAILEEIHTQGSNGGACHAQMYTMGTVLKYGSEKQKNARHELNGALVIVTNKNARHELISAHMIGNQFLFLLRRNCVLFLS